MACALVSAFMTPQLAPGASLCRCDTPVKEGTEARRTLRCASNGFGRKRKMVGGHGPGGPLRPGPHGRRSAAFPVANQFMWRVDDAIAKYHPDVIYFDEHAGDSQVDLGVHMGLGFLAPILVANYYNKSLQWNHGKMDAVINRRAWVGVTTVSRITPNYFLR